MRWRQAHIFTLKEAPADAEITSHKLLVRGGFIKKMAPGLYTFSHLGLRALRKFEQIIREELDKRDCTEVLMPMVQPRELWEETNRWAEMGAGLLKFQNRNQHWYCLGATHEEAVTDYIRNDIKSYRDLPRNIYQIQTKYRDEIRPRFGLLRCREFLMKDAYSFDLNREGALKVYQQMYEAYQAIFNRLGLNYRIVQADAGNIGGSQTHEFQLLAEAGEDALLVSDESDFAANVEVCPAEDFALSQVKQPTPESSQSLEKFPTPGLKTIKQLSEALKVADSNLVKTLFYSANQDPKSPDLKPVCILLRGSDEANPIKIKNILGLANPPELLTDEEVKQVSGAWPGSCGPVGLQMPVYVDYGVEKLGELIVGANEDGFHLRHVQLGRDFTAKKIADLRLAKAGDKDPKSNGRLRAVRGIEVGHVFYLGTKYSQKMNATFLDSTGAAQPIEMGCYGIGVSRTVQAAIEQSHDKDGIIWPVSIAPFQVHVCPLDVQDRAVMDLCFQIESALHEQGYETLVDDRDERPGVKFKDADLLGMPLRVVIGQKGLANGEIELVERKTKLTKKIKLNEAINEILSELRRMS
jgi:prolyl-tRNA synthetase